MDRFRLTDPDAAEKAARIYLSTLNSATVFGGNVRHAMRAVLDAIEPEQPRLPTRSEVESKFEKEWGGTMAWDAEEFAQALVDIQVATEDPEPEVDPAQALLNLLREARDELNRWGHGDFHYGDTPQEESVVSMVARIDAVLVSGRVQVTPKPLERCADEPMP